jgi:hypothetical protein
VYQPSVLNLFAVAKVQDLKIGQPLQMHQPRVRNIGGAQVHLSQPLRSFQVRQTGVSEVRSAGGEFFKLGQSIQQARILQIGQWRTGELNSDDRLAGELFIS